MEPSLQPYDLHFEHTKITRSYNNPNKHYSFKAVKTISDFITPAIALLRVLAHV